MKGARVGEEIEKARKVILRKRLENVEVLELGVGVVEETTRVFRVQLTDAVARTGATDLAGSTFHVKHCTGKRSSLSSSTDYDASTPLRGKSLISTGGDVVRSRRQQFPAAGAKTRIFTVVEPRRGASARRRRRSTWAAALAHGGARRLPGDRPGPAGQCLDRARRGSPGEVASIYDVHRRRGADGGHRAALPRVGDAVVLYPATITSRAAPRSSYVSRRRAVRQRLRTAWTSCTVRRWTSRTTTSSSTARRRWGSDDQRLRGSAGSAHPDPDEYYALEGLSQLLRNIELIERHLNPNLRVSTILLTMYDGRTNLSNQVAPMFASTSGTRSCRR